MSKPICPVCVDQLNVRTDRFICNACGRQCHSQCLFEDPNFKEWDKTMLATALKFVVSSVCKVDAAKAVKTNAKLRSLQPESRRIDDALDAYKTDAQRRLIEYVDTLQCNSCWRYGHIKRTCTTYIVRIHQYVNSVVVRTRSKSVSQAMPRHNAQIVYATIEKHHRRYRSIIQLHLMHVPCENKSN